MLLHQATVRKATVGKQINYLLFSSINTSKEFIKEKVLRTSNGKSYHA